MPCSSLSWFFLCFAFIRRIARRFLADVFLLRVFCVTQQGKRLALRHNVTGYFCSSDDTPRTWCWWWPWIRSLGCSVKAVRTYVNQDFATWFDSLVICWLSLWASCAGSGGDYLYDLFHSAQLNGVRLCVIALIRYTRLLIVIPHYTINKCQHMQLVRGTGILTSQAFGCCSLFKIWLMKRGSHSTAARGSHI